MAPLLNCSFSCRKEMVIQAPNLEYCSLTRVIPSYNSRNLSCRFHGCVAAASKVVTPITWHWQICVSLLMIVPEILFNRPFKVGFGSNVTQYLNHISISYGIYAKKIKTNCGHIKAFVRVVFMITTHLLHGIKWFLNNFLWLCINDMIWECGAACDMAHLLVMPYVLMALPM